MPAVTITIDDLIPFSPDINPVKAQAMIEDALARAALIAPCINDADFPHSDAAKAILRGAILRWDDAGAGVVVQWGAGSFQESVDTRQQRKSLFWPSEIVDLQGLCADGGEDAYMVDMTGLGVTSTNPLSGAVINAWSGEEPQGERADPA